MNKYFISKSLWTYLQCSITEYWQDHCWLRENLGSLDINLGVTLSLVSPIECYKIRVGIFYTKTKKYADKFHITKVKVRKIDLRFDLHLTVTWHSPQLQLTNWQSSKLSLIFTIPYLTLIFKNFTWWDRRIW